MSTCNCMGCPRANRGNNFQCPCGANCSCRCTLNESKSFKKMVNITYDIENLPEIFATSILNSKMDPEHDHLNSLLEEETLLGWTKLEWESVLNLYEDEFIDTITTIDDLLKIKRWQKELTPTITTHADKLFEKMKHLIKK